MGIVNKVSEHNAKCKEITDVLYVEIGFVTSGDRLLRFAPCRVCKQTSSSPTQNNEFFCNSRRLSFKQLPTVL